MRPAAVLCVLYLLSGSGIAAAQTAADEIRSKVKEGQKVSVTDDQGREFKGRIGNLTADALSIVTGADRADIAYGSIVRIDRPQDTLANGALIGLAAGAAFGFAAMWAEDHRSCDPQVWFDCSDPTAAGYVVVSAVSGALGSAIGVGVDALIRRDRDIYRRGRDTRISLSPAWGPRSRGAVVAISW